MTKPSAFWNDRFSGDTYIYGVEPNRFVEEAAETWLSANQEVLALGAGEGRNAVYLGREGHMVTAVDYSTEGLRKTRHLAKEWGVQLSTIHADVRDWTPERTWDAVIVTFLHFHAPERVRLYRLIQRLLRSNGVLVAEWFRPEQRTEGYSSGGPPDPNMMVTPGELREHFPAEGIEYLQEVEATLDEGMHQGPAATVRFVWRSP